MIKKNLKKLIYKNVAFTISQRTVQRKNRKLFRIKYNKLQTTLLTNNSVFGKEGGATFLSIARNKIFYKRCSHFVK